MDINFETLRQEFPVLGRKTYLNSGSYCALANTVKSAFESYMEDRLIIGANWDVWVQKNEAVRGLVADLLHATPDEIAVTASVTAGLNSLASALSFDGERNKVVVTDFEFPTNAQIWHAQEPRGAKVVHVGRDADGYIPLEHFEQAIDEHTKLVAITQVCFRNGAKLDIAGIARIARKKGAMVLLDTYQAVGAVDIDVKALDLDFAVGGMLKYLLGTAGIGFLYVRDALIPTLVPTNSGWFTQVDIQAMDITRNNPHPSARRFEGGTPAVVNCYAAEAGLRIILDVGTANIERRIQSLVATCMDRLDAIGWSSITPRDQERRAAMVCIPSRDSGGLMRKLLEHDIVTSHRDDNLRISLHYYNNEADIDALIAGLQACQQKFQPARS
jgi:selenocysteine lyase/cysteine desulfurase